MFLLRRVSVPDRVAKRRQFSSNLNAALRRTISARCLYLYRTYSRQLSRVVFLIPLLASSPWVDFVFCLVVVLFVACLIFFLAPLPQRAEMTTLEGGHLPYPPHFRVVPIEIDLGAGKGSATVLGSDLTAEYVHINGDYRS